MANGTWVASTGNRVGKRPDTPCSICGKLLYTSPTSAPADQRRCRPCRSALAAEPRPCERCTKPFVGTRHSRFCSTKCRGRAPQGHGPRVDRTYALSGDYSRASIFERDGWRCGLCGDLVDRAAKFPDPRSPSIDHMVPISLGGRDEAANVQCSHLVCNLRKGTHPMGEQLRLIG